MHWSPGMCLWARCYGQDILTDDSVHILIILTLIEFTHLFLHICFFFCSKRGLESLTKVSMIQLYSCEWESFENLPRLTNIPILPPSHTTSHPQAAPLPSAGRFRNVLRNLLKRQISLLCICQLFWIYKWLTCFPKFLRHRKDFNLDRRNLISRQRTRSKFLLALKGSFLFLLPVFEVISIYLINTCRMSTTCHPSVGRGACKNNVVCIWIQE